MSSVSKEIANLTISINKALNAMEAPLKIKHARSVIITTHRTKEAKSFWIIVMRQPLMAYRFTAWKFCHLLHKVLREGHESTIKQSQTHKKMLIEVGKLWGHLEDGVGNCIHAYCKLIVTKLDFHEKNVQFPGSLQINFRDYEEFAGDDINIYFQLCVEIFDYIEDIIEVQEQVFNSITTYRISSMMPQGQCRLAPLIPLIQDSNPLYDICVRVMFKLHDKLPSDVLAGHRDRFRTMFNKLKGFYDWVRPLQYFADLIQVPRLPETAPNFTSQVDFGSYSPPVMFVQPDPEPTVDNLVDTSVLDIPTTPIAFHNEITALEKKVRERDLAIKELQHQVAITREGLNCMETKYREDLTSARDEIGLLNNELANTKELYINIRSLKDDLELKVAKTPKLLQKATEGEEKAKASEEKFSKLRIMYTQIRDEHINLLRQNGEANKLLNKERFNNSELKSEVEQLRSEIGSFKQVTEKYDLKCEELNLQVRDSKQELNTQMQLYEYLKTDYDKLQADNCSVKDQLAQKDAQLEKATATIEESKNEIKRLESSLLEVTEAQRLDRDELTAAVSTGKVELETKVGELQALQAEIARLRSEIATLREQIEQHERRESDLQLQIETGKQELTARTELYDQLKADYEKLQAENCSGKQQLEQKDTLLGETATAVAESKHEIKRLESSLLEVTEAKRLDHAELSAAVATANAELATKVQEQRALEEAHEQLIHSKDEQIKEITETMTSMEADLKGKETLIEGIRTEKLKLENELQDMLQQHSTLESKYTSTVANKEALIQANSESELRFGEIIRSLLREVLQTMSRISTVKCSAANMQSYEKTLRLLDDLEQLLGEVTAEYQVFCGDKNCVEGLMQKAIYLGHNFTMLHEQCQLISNTTTNIDQGDDIFNHVNRLCEPLLQLFQLMPSIDNAKDVNQSVNGLKAKLAELGSLLSDLIKASGQKVDLDDLVEKELKEMDKAIEEAADKFDQLLSKARREENGIKLEVNEKILDACTSLMECIKQLIQRSKVLQEEIVSTGRGSATAKEFYKRNSQWTEGLISASKSVAKGANLLVDAANKAVNGESKQNFEIIVAAQEIAACTAQLVIASKVKAAKESNNLLDLTKASRNVSQATGAVVATVKDCNLQLEQSQEIDFSKLTSSQAKTMQMEMHVKVLELEQALQAERYKLSSFRKNHYQNNED